MNFKDIPLFPRAHYEIDVEWRYLETQIASSDLYLAINAGGARPTPPRN